MTREPPFGWDPLEPAPGQDSLVYQGPAGPSDADRRMGLDRTTAEGQIVGFAHDVTAAHGWRRLVGVMLLAVFLLPAVALLVTVVGRLIGL